MSSTYAMGMIASYLYTALSLLVVWLIKKYVVPSSSNPRNAPYPPGPKPLPLIGNAFDFPTTKSYEVFLEWGAKYKSDFVYVSALGNKVLVVNKLEDADELFERRASKYSDRPIIPITKLLGWEFNIAMIPYGKSWRFHRKIFQQNFRAEAARDYYPLLLRKTREMLHSLLVDPDNFEGHNKMLSISIPMITMYGYEVKSFQDPCVAAAEESITLASKLSIPGGTWINVIPALAYVPPWFPGATGRKVAEKVYQLTKEMRRIPQEFVRKGIAEGTAIPSFVSNFLKRKLEVGASAEEEEAVQNIASTVYLAASDTTMSATSTFFYLMAVHPEVQRKAQAELDRVVGIGRLPEFNDRTSLPYIEAIYREVLRVGAPLPLGAPHSLSEDDYYKGYFIPKGTMALGNIWAMTHDEDRYPDSFKFKPERYFDKEGKLNDDNRILAYGYGRRVCAGKYIASATMWITIASVLACFDIGKCKDEFGNEIEINDDFDDLGVFRHKSKFRCAFVPRHPMIQQLIDETR